jgi:class 3 adenylate cyclase
MSQTRRLAAILAADVTGYSRLMGADEEGTHERLQAHLRELVNPKIGEHRGRIVKNTGDGLLAEFPSVVDAVRCAVEIQRRMIDREPELPEERRIRFRIGINLGDVIAEEHDIFGDGVNVAARLEALAEPNGICISRTVRDQIRDKLPYLSRIKASRASRTSLGQYGSMRCGLKPSPICLHLWRRLPPQPPSPCLRRACRLSCCRSPISATTRSSNTSRTGSPRI